MEEEVVPDCTGKAHYQKRGLFDIEQSVVFVTLKLIKCYWFFSSSHSYYNVLTNSVCNANNLALYKNDGLTDRN